MKPTKIAKVLDALISDYCKDNLKKPIAIVLGPYEYIALCEHLQGSTMTIRDPLILGTFITEYNGYEVLLKELPGIDLIVSPTDVYNYL